jgi:hypothetical protein
MDIVLPEPYTNWKRHTIKEGGVKDVNDYYHPYGKDFYSPEYKRLVNGEEPDNQIFLCIGIHYKKNYNFIGTNITNFGFYPNFIEYFRVLYENSPGIDFLRKRIDTIGFPKRYFPGYEPASREPAMYAINEVSRYYNIYKLIPPEVNKNRPFNELSEQEKTDKFKEVPNSIRDPNSIKNHKSTPTNNLSRTSENVETNPLYTNSDTKPNVEPEYYKKSPIIYNNNNDNSDDDAESGNLSKIEGETQKNSSNENIELPNRVSNTFSIGNEFSSRQKYEKNTPASTRENVAFNAIEDNQLGGKRRAKKKQKSTKRRRTKRRRTKRTKRRFRK